MAQGNKRNNDRPSSRVQEMMNLDEDLQNDGDDTVDTLIIKKSDIPMYEIGLAPEDYVPKEIKSGKVVKVTEDDFEELYFEELRHHKSQKERKREEKEAAKESVSPRQRTVKRVVILGIWLVTLLVCAMLFLVCYNVFYDVPVNPDSTATYEYVVEEGMSDDQVYADLTELGVIDCSKFIYKLRALVFSAEYVAGTYTLSDGYNTEKIINILAGYNYGD